MRRRVLIDLETTALTPQRGEIIRLYARDLNDPFSTFNQIVKPKLPLSKLVQQITGITNEMVRIKPSLEAVFPLFFGYLNGAELEWASEPFDRPFIAAHSKSLCLNALCILNRAERCEGYKVLMVNNVRCPNRSFW